MFRLTCIFGPLTLAALGFAQDFQPPGGHQAQPPVYLCPVADGNYCYSGNLQSLYIIRCRNGSGTLGNCNDIPHRGGDENRCYQPDPRVYDAACSTSMGVVYPEDSRDPFLLPNHLKPGPLGQPVPPLPLSKPGQGPGGLPPFRPPANYSNNNSNNNTDVNQDRNQNSSGTGSGGPANPGSPSGGDLSGPETVDANNTVNNSNTNVIGNEKKKIGASKYYGAVSKVPQTAVDVDFDEMEMDGLLIKRQEDETAENATGVRPEVKTYGVIVAIAMVVVLLQ